MEVAILLKIYLVEYVCPIKGINESKILVKHISWKCKFEFDGRKCNSGQKWNNDRCQFECKKTRKHYVCKKVMPGILAYVLASLMRKLRLVNI